MADGLYLADGTFRTFSIESLTTELATRQNAGLYLGDVGGWLTQLPGPELSALLFPPRRAGREGRGCEGPARS